MAHVSQHYFIRLHRLEWGGLWCWGWERGSWMSNRGNCDYEYHYHNHFLKLCLYKWQPLLLRTTTSSRCHMQASKGTTNFWKPFLRGSYLSGAISGAWEIWSLFFPFSLIFFGRSSLFLDPLSVMGIGYRCMYIYICVCVCVRVHVYTMLVPNTCVYSCMHDTTHVVYMHTVCGVSDCSYLCPGTFAYFSV